MKTVKTLKLMKANRLVFTVLLLFSAAVFQLAAEQTEIDLNCANRKARL